MCSFTFGSPVYVRKAKNVLLMFYIQFRASWRALVRYYCSHLRQWLACCPCKLAFEEHCSCTDPGRCEPSGQWPHHQTSLGLGCCNKAGHDACSLSQARAGSSLKWSAMRRKKKLCFLFFLRIKPSTLSETCYHFTCFTWTMISLFLALLWSCNSSPKHRVTVGSGAGIWPSWYSCRAGAYKTNEQLFR